ncbi:MAG: Sec-independent protein translocase protein TatB, partial [Eubacteriales bacterium]|nr:Sec-independent protein translocase protein TatB [Eubacteriales bacterium]
GNVFNIGFTELILILLVAFLVVGPKDLPKVARSLGRFVRYLKAKWAEFIQETDMADTISELKGTKKDLEETIREADSTADLKKTQNSLDKTMNELKQAVKNGKSPVDR